MSRESDMREAIINDIMENPLEGFNLEIIRDALEAYYALASVAELEAEYKGRAFP